MRGQKLRCTAFPRVSHVYNIINALLKHTWIAWTLLFFVTSGTVNKSPPYSSAIRIRYVHIHGCIVLDIDASALSHKIRARLRMNQSAGTDDERSVREESSRLSSASPPLGVSGERERPTRTRAEMRRSWPVASSDSPLNRLTFLGWFLLR